MVEKGWPWRVTLPQPSRPGMRSSGYHSTPLTAYVYLYVRQSMLRQVIENTESTQRRYALRQRAVALGWPIERIVVIDHDLGQSGAAAADREGFQQLVRDVSTIRFVFVSLMIG